MNTPRKQAGWYNGALIVTLVMAVVLFISQPWIPLLLGVTLGAVMAVIGLSHGADHLKHWYQDHHHPHAH